MNTRCVIGLNEWIEMVYVSAMLASNLSPFFPPVSLTIGLRGGKRGKEINCE